MTTPVGITAEEWELAQERVADGAEVLGQYVPDWARLIDRDRLDLSSPCDCVLGQAILPDRFPAVYAEIRKARGLVTNATVDGYDAAHWVLDIPQAVNLNWVTADVRWMVAHGFTGWDGRVSYEALTAAWLVEVDRQLAVNP